MDGAMILLLILLVIYFVPLIVALARESRNAAQIAVLNIFLGWTLVGWVCALIWAMKPRDVAPKVQA